MVSLKNTSCQQHTSDLRHSCRYTYTHWREPAVYYTHRLWLFTRSFSHHLMIDMPLSNACSSAIQCLQSQLVLFFLFLFFFLSDISFFFFPDLSLFSSSHPSLMTLSGRIMNPLPCFCPLHSSSMAAAHLHFLCCCLRKGKELILRKAIQVLRFFMCPSDWRVWNPAELTSRHSLIFVSSLLHSLTCSLLFKWPLHL